MEFVFVKKIVDEWARMGHHCVVVTTFSLSAFFRNRIEYKPRHYVYEVAPGITVDVYNPRCVTIKATFRGVSFDSYMEKKVVEHLLNRIDIRFDFVYCHFFSSSVKGFYFAASRNTPFYIATGESEIPDLLKPYRGFTWELFRKYTNGIISVSSKNMYEAYEKGYIDKDKSKVFPNGTDTNLFKPQDRIKCREFLGFPHDAFIIICVGFICERKGQNRLLEAVHSLKDKNIKIVFIGAQAKIESFPLWGEEIIFKGAVENKHIPMYLCSSDIFCLPTRAEGCCNAVIEAMACGLPIISSNLPFNRDVLNKNNSILVDPNSIDEISKAIRLLKGNDKLRLKLGKKAFEDAQGLSLKKRSKDILDFIEERIR